jgi:hypothetical protein
MYMANYTDTNTHTRTAKYERADTGSGAVAAGICEPQAPPWA